MADKTFGEWIPLLPKAYEITFMIAFREANLKAYGIPGDEKAVAVGAKLASHMLGLAFPWDDAPQGQKYWIKVFEHLREIEDEF